MLQSLLVFAQQTGTATSVPEVNLPPSTALAIIHALLSILGALSIAVAYYTTSTIKRPSSEPRYLRNSKLMFLGSLLPAPVAGWLSVAGVERVAPYVAGDYRYEWPVAFAAGTVAMAIIKKLAGGLLMQEVLPKSAPQSEEN